MNSELNAQRHAARKILWAWGNTLNRIERLEAYRRAFELFAEDARETLHAQSLSGMPRGGRSRDISDIVVKVTERAQKYEQEAQKVDVQIADALRLRSTVEDFHRDEDEHGHGSLPQDRSAGGGQVRKKRVHPINWPVFARFIVVYWEHGRGASERRASSCCLPPYFSGQGAGHVPPPAAGALNRYVGGDGAHGKKDGEGREYETIRTAI